MEREFKIKASYEEMKDVFDNDEIILVKHFEEIEEGLYYTILRIPECNLKQSYYPTTFKTIRKNIKKNIIE